MLTMGTMTFGGTGQFAKVGSTDAEEARRQVDMCLEAGVNLIDTADVYSAGRSEEIVGEALRGRRDERPLATKVRMPMGPGPNDAGLSRHHILSRLRGQPAPPRHRPHRPVPGARMGRPTPLEETLEALDSLVRSGKVRYVGCSNYTALAADEGAGHRRPARLRRFVSQQIYYSLQAREAEYELIPPRSTRVSASWCGARWPAACCPASTGAGGCPGGLDSSKDWGEPPVYDEEALRHHRGPGDIADARGV